MTAPGILKRHPGPVRIEDSRPVAGHEGFLMTDLIAGAQTQRPAPKRILVHRHSIWVRLTHWIWVVCLTLLLMSGLQIFNAYPALNFGQATTFNRGVLIISTNDTGTQGVTTVLGHDFNTTGVLGISNGPDGLAARAFPSWATLPSSQDLATARRWHFLLAWILVLNGFVYLIHGFLSRHIPRDILPKFREFKMIPRDIADHLRLRFHHGTAALHYNVLQKISYAVVLFVILPVLVLAGMAMSPGLDAAFPWLREIFAGRQSARTIHFMMATLLVLFVVVHLVMVLLSGVFNNLRGMITGSYAIDEDKP
jgi:thiosulfate reductase cytochrome b subunit